MKAEIKKKQMLTKKQMQVVQGGKSGEVVDRDKKAVARNGKRN